MPDEGARSAPLNREQYQQAIFTIRGGEDSTKASRLFFAVVGEMDKADCSPRIHELHDRLAAILDQVRNLSPPAEAAEAQREFLTAADQSVRYVAQAATDVDEDTLACGQAMNDRIYGLPSTVEAEKAIEKLEQLGYAVLGD